MPLIRWLLILACCAGCVSTDEGGRYPHPAPEEAGPEHVAPNPLVEDESEFLDVGLELEFAEQHGKALRHYAIALAPDAGVTPRLVARSHLRTAACLIQLQRKPDAVSHLRAVLRNDRVAPADDSPAPFGGERAPLRRDAEGRLRDLGEDPVAVYEEMLSDRNNAARPIAVVSLAVLGGTRCKQLLEKLVGDASVSASLRDLARDELAGWGSRSR